MMGGAGGGATWAWANFAQARNARAKLKLKRGLRPSISLEIAGKVPPGRAVLRGVLLKIEGQLRRVLDSLLNRDEERHRFFPIHRAVIVAQGEIHHRANHDLIFHGDRSFLDRVHSKDSALRSEEHTSELQSR